ncbi:MAG: glycosyltransferase [Actinomycetota bacterium]
MPSALLTSSAGGHLSELVRLSKRMVDVDRFVWAVPDNDQSRSLLGSSRSDWVIEPIPPLGSRALVGAARLGPVAGRLIERERPSLVLSTGAAPAVPFLLQAARRNLPAYYVESLARLAGPSLSGRILARVPRVRLRTQHDSLDWPGWRSVGLGLGHYRREAASPSGPMKVVVTVGTTTFDFRRLFVRLAGVLPSDAQVTWQTGHSDVDGLDLPGARALVPAAELHAAMAEADVVVAHAGVGSAFDALDAGRLPILVPRRSGHGEHVDDHQAEVARWLTERDLAITAEAEDLDGSVLSLAAHARVSQAGPPEPLVLD